MQVVLGTEGRLVPWSGCVTLVHYTRGYQIIIVRHFVLIICSVSAIKHQNSKVHNFTAYQLIIPKCKATNRQLLKKNYGQIIR